MKLKYLVIFLSMMLILNVVRADTLSLNVDTPQYEGTANGFNYVSFAYNLNNIDADKINNITFKVTSTSCSFTYETPILADELSRGKEIYGPIVIKVPESCGNNFNIIVEAFGIKNNQKISLGSKNFVGFNFEPKEIVYFDQPTNNDYLKLKIEAMKWTGVEGNDYRVKVIYNLSNNVLYNNAYYNVTDIKFNINYTTLSGKKGIVETSVSINKLRYGESNLGYFEVKLPVPLNEIFNLKIKAMGKLEGPNLINPSSYNINSSPVNSPDIEIIKFGNAYELFLVSDYHPYPLTLKSYEFRGDNLTHYFINTTFKLSSKAPDGYIANNSYFKISVSDAQIFKSQVITGALGSGESKEYSFLIAVPKDKITVNGNQASFDLTAQAFFNVTNNYLSSIPLSYNSSKLTKTILFNALTQPENNILNFVNWKYVGSNSTHHIFNVNVTLTNKDPIAEEYQGTMRDIEFEFSTSCMTPFRMPVADTIKIDNSKNYSFTIAIPKSCSTDFSLYIQAFYEIRYYDELERKFVVEDSNSELVTKILTIENLNNLPDNQQPPEPVNNAIICGTIPCFPYSSNISYVKTENDKHYINLTYSLLNNYSEENDIFNVSITFVINNSTKSGAYINTTKILGDNQKLEYDKNISGSYILEIPASVGTTFNISTRAFGFMPSKLSMIYSNINNFYNFNIPTQPQPPVVNPSNYNVGGGGGSSGGSRGPDLEISNIYVEPSTFYEGDLVTLKADIKNRALSERSFKVDFIFNGITYSINDLNYVGRDSIKTVSIQANVPSTDKLDVTVKVYSDGSIITNSKSFNVSTKFKYFVVSSVSEPFMSYKSDKAVYVLNIYNTGLLADTYKVEDVSGWTDFEISKNKFSLPIKNSKEISITFNRDPNMEAGNYPIKVKICNTENLCVTKETTLIVEDKIIPVSVECDKEKKVEFMKGDKIVYNFKVTNLRDVSDKYQFIIESTNLNYTLSPKSALIEPNETEDVTVSAKPSQNSASMTFIVADSEGDVVYKETYEMVQMGLLSSVVTGRFIGLSGTSGSVIGLGILLLAITGGVSLSIMGLKALRMNSANTKVSFPSSNTGPTENSNNNSQPNIINDYLNSHPRSQMNNIYNTNDYNINQENKI